MAGGFTIDNTKIEDFKNFLVKRFDKIMTNTNEDKKYFLDSSILPSAVNINFYDKIHSLAPFGSGNSEPRFTIENLKVVNSKIVGENHIKTVLIGEDGSILKCIAFNSTKSNLEPYLFKKSKKTFNIAGKLSLNEWKGNKNVEFIIDDISVNKNNKNVVPSSIG